MPGRPPMVRPLSRNMSTFYHSILSLRNRHFLLLDGLFLLISPLLALLLRVDVWDARLRIYAPALVVYTAILFVVCLAIFYRMGLYRRFWRYASVDDLWQILAAVALGSLLGFVVYAAAIAALNVMPGVQRVVPLPRSVPLIDTLLVAAFVGAARFSVRLVARHQRLARRPGDAARKAVVVMGAGDTGAIIVREIQNNPQLGLDVVAFLDDDPAKHNHEILGVRVRGDRHVIPQLVAARGVERVIIAMPTAPGKQIRQILALCQECRVEAKTMPGVFELLGGQVSVKQLRDVQLEDLLRRDAVHTDMGNVQNLVRGRRVLVTGAGGSIGREICRQVVSAHPSELILLGHGENSIFEIYHELLDAGGGAVLPYDGSDSHAPARSAAAAVGGGASLPPTRLHPVIADIRFAERVEAVMRATKPHLVLHAAAHKHVPLMEHNPAEAVTNNILGTRNVVQAAAAVGVERLVMVSTDKAVRPTSIMGASKRVAEMVVLQAARQTRRPYMAVRFGNVLGSRGSVVLTFKEQIARGGPLTVTHPDMRRYFMTIPEAVHLTLQAAALGQGGEVFLLDMGEPVYIVDMARELLRLSGLQEGHDIDIVFTGLRSGEKLFEEMFGDGEDHERTAHERIFVVKNASRAVPPHLDDAIAALSAAAQRDDRAAIMLTLRALVVEFQTSPHPAPPSQPRVAFPGARPAAAPGAASPTVGS